MNVKEEYKIWKSNFQIMYFTLLCEIVASWTLKHFHYLNDDNEFHPLKKVFVSVQFWLIALGMRPECTRRRSVVSSRIFDTRWTTIDPVYLRIGKSTYQKVQPFLNQWKCFVFTSFAHTRIFFREFRKRDIIGTNLNRIALISDHM